MGGSEGLRNPYILLILLSTLTSSSARAAAACAVSPSPSANNAAGPLRRRPSFGSKAIKLMRLTKSATLNGLAKRAVPSVGITWLGPAT